MAFRTAVQTRLIALALSAGLAGAAALVTAPAAAAAPSTAPVPVSPAQDAVVSADPVFAWGSVNGAVKYHFQLSTATTFSSTLYDVTTYGLHATSSTSLPSGVLFWRVAALDGSSAAGPWSATVQFTKSAQPGPSLVSPADGAALSYPTDPPVLVWSPVAGAKSYTVDVDDNDTFTSPVTTTTASSQLALTEPPALGTPQFWRVKASIGTSLTTDYSPTRSFSVSWPEAPTLLGPADGAHVNDIRLQWSAVGGAKTYEVQISPNGDFQNNLVSLGTEALNVTGTHYAPKSALQPRAYYWRVRPRDNATSVHPGAWSATGSFTVDVAPAPTALAPGLSTASPGTPPTVVEPALSWQGSSRASYYEVQVGTDQNFSPTTYQTCLTYHTTLTPFFDVEAPQPSGPGVNICDVYFGASRYFWRVRGVEQLAGTTGTFNGAWSVTMSFFRGADYPVITGPGDFASTDTPILSWSRVQGYNKYRVTIQKVGSSSVYTKDTYALSYTPLAGSVTPPVAVGDYLWTVQTLDSAGNPGPVGPTMHYTLAAPTTGALTLNAPDGTASTNMPSMSWEPVSGAETYRVYYRAAGGTTWINLAGIQKIFLPAYTSPGEPLPDGDYEWFVEAYSSVGGLLAASAAKTFTISPSAVVSYLGPTNCLAVPSCADLRDTPQLSWTGTPDTHFYRVHIATDPGFANELRVYRTENTTITFAESLPDSQADQSYYWFVQPCKSPSRCGAFNDANLPAREQSFRKATAGVELLQPADAASVGDDPHFSWTDYFATNSGSSAGSGAKAYHLQVATDSAFTNVVDDVTVDSTSYTPFTKEYADGTYYWQVQAVDGAGQALTYSATRVFQKSSLQPVLNAVATTTPLPTLTWSPLPYVSGYKVEIYPGLTTNVGTVLSTTTKLPALTPSSSLDKGTYTWRVAKLDPSGNRGPWSSTSTFEVTLSPPLLTSPSDGAQLTTDDILFTWNPPVSGVALTTYRFESSTSLSFVPALETQLTTGTTWATPKLYPTAVPVYWRVSALDAQSHVLSTSAVRTFSKDAIAPTVTAVTPTADVPLGGPFTVTFSEKVVGVNGSSLVVYPSGAPSQQLAGTVTLAAGRTSATFTPTGLLVPGQTYVVSASSAITDDAGNPLVASAVSRRAARTVDSASPAITELWDTDSSVSASGGAYATSRLAGATMTFTFTGTSTSLKATKTPLGGNADVYLDGVKQATVAFYRSSTAYQQVVWSKSGLTSGAHTVVVRVLGTRPAGSTSNYVYVDAFTADSTTVQENGSGVRPGFSRVSNVSAAGASYDRELLDASGDNGGKPEFRMTFAGTGLTWYATKTATSGKAAVYIDGVLKGTADLFSSGTSMKAKAFASAPLSAGTHTLRIVLLGTRNASSAGTEVSVDQLVVT